MTMTLALILFVLGVLAFFCWVLYKMGELDDRQERLDKYSVHLDERANKLSAWEQELIHWDREVGK